MCASFGQTFLVVTENKGRCLPSAALWAELLFGRNEWHLFIFPQLISPPTMSSPSEVLSPRSRQSEAGAKERSRHSDGGRRFAAPAAWQQSDYLTSLVLSFLESLLSSLDNLLTDISLQLSGQDHDNDLWALQNLTSSSRHYIISGLHAFYLLKCPEDW